MAIYSNGTMDVYVDGVLEVRAFTMVKQNEEVLDERQVMPLLRAEPVLEEGETIIWTVGQAIPEISTGV